MNEQGAPAFNPIDNDALLSLKQYALPLPSLCVTLIFSFFLDILHCSTPSAGDRFNCFHFAVLSSCTLHVNNYFISVVEKL